MDQYLRHPMWLYVITQTISVLHEIEAMAKDVGIVVRVRGCNSTCTRIAKDIGVCVDGLDDGRRHGDAAHW